MKHTPKPWTVVQDAQWTLIVSSNDRLVAEYNGAGSESLPSSERTANMQLISAAPDLLEALQELAGWQTTAPQKYIDAAHAAIAKALNE